MKIQKTGRFSKKTAMMTSLLLLFASFVVGAFVFLNGSQESSDAATTVTVSLSEGTSTVSSGNSTIDEIDRHGKSWWKFSLTGVGSSQTIFCLNSDKSMHTGDTLTYVTYNAATYSNQNLAKALTWYNTVGTISGLEPGQVRYAVQAYCWASTTSGADILTAVEEALERTKPALTSSEVSSRASALVSAINNTAASGTIYYYTGYTCSSHTGYSHSTVESTHQHLIGWVATSTSIPEYADVYQQYKDKYNFTYSITITKKDSATSALIDTAQFEILFDNTNVNSLSGYSLDTTTGTTDGTLFSTSGGKVTITITRSETVTGDYITKTYVTNWNELSLSQQKEAKNNGYYSNATDAQNAANTEAQESFDTKVAQIKSTSHTWKVTEKVAPLGHSLPSTATQTKTATANQTTPASVEFVDSARYVKVTVTKSTKSGYSSLVGVEATLSGAKYGVYANETIYDTNNSKVLYEPGDLVTTVTTNSSGAGTSSAVLPYGYSYFVQEITAPKGYELDATPYDFTATSTTNTVSANQEIPTYGNVKVYKVYEDSDANKHPEEDAAFTVTNTKDTSKVYTLTLQSDHETIDGVEYAVYTYEGLPYGTYTLKQTGGHAETIFTTDRKFSITEGAGTVTKTFTITNYYEAPAISIIKQTQTYQENGTTELTEESGAVFYALKSTSSDSFTVYSFSVDSNGDVTLDTSKSVSYTELNSLTEDQRQQYVSQLLTYAQTAGISNVFATLTSSSSGVESVVVLTTDKNGEAFSYLNKSASERKYVVLQTAGTDGYRLSDAQTCTVPANSLSAVSYTLANEKYQDYFSITKYIIDVNRTESSKEPEENAEFAILDASYLTVARIKASMEEEDYNELIEDLAEVTVDTLLNAMDADQRAAFVETLPSAAVLGTITTDENGAADIYLPDHYEDGFAVLQTAGTKGYALMPVLYQKNALTADEVAAATDGMTEKELQAYEDAGYIVVSDDTTRDYITDYTIVYTDPYDFYGFIGIIKYAEEGYGEWKVEEGAEFEITDASGEVVATLVTDAKGYATTIQYDSDGDICGGYMPYGTYVITQTYAPGNTELLPPTTVYVSKNSYHVEKVYTYENEAEGVSVQLAKASDDTGAPVEGATYTIYAVENIYNTSIQNMDGKTGWISDLEEDDNGNSVWYSTSEPLYTKGEAVGTITTDENGTGILGLEYGTYYLEETGTPHTFVQSSEKIYFTLDAKGITIYDTEALSEQYLVIDDVDLLLACDSTFTKYDSTYTAYIEVEDTPVYGEIWIAKTGQVLDTTDGGSYTYVSATVEGAKFSLYALEDICDDAGNVIWSAGTFIAEATTDADGSAVFTWTKNGEETRDFYLGTYGVVETYAPDGYTLDTELHEVVLTYDHSADNIDDLRDVGEASGTGSDYGNSGPYESEGSYILDIGTNVNAILTSINPRAIIFTWKSVPSGVTAQDVSADSDNSVKLWTVDDTVYISSCKSNQVVYLNAISSYLFANCTNLQTISFNNVDTSICENMSYMFYQCSSLEVLDLSMFNTSLVSYVQYMFEGCTSLETIYVNDQTIVVNRETATLSSITADPVTIFTSEYTYNGQEVAAQQFEVSDFTFTGWYTADYYETPFSGTINLTEADIDYFAPAEANSKYKATDWYKMDDDEEEAAYFDMYVTIYLKSTSEYYEVSGGYITVLVTVSDPTRIHIETKYEEHPVETVEVDDAPIKLEIALTKVATEDTSKHLSNAKYGLYANCDIADAEGNILYKAGDLISTATSSSANETVLATFTGLPTNVYAVAGTYLTPTCGEDGTIYYMGSSSLPNGYQSGTSSSDEYMYYVVELAPPVGYSLSYDAWYITADVYYLNKTDTNVAMTQTYTNSEGKEVTISYTRTSTAETSLEAYYTTKARTSYLTNDDPLSEYITVAKEWDDDEDNGSAPDDRPTYVLFHIAGTVGSKSFDYILKLTENELTAYAYSDALWENPEYYLNYAEELCVWQAYTGTCDSDGNDIWYANLDVDSILSGSSSYAVLKKSGSKTTTITTFEENRTALAAQNSDYNIKYIGNGHYSDNTWVYWAINNRSFPIRVTKVWEDEGDAEGMRPTSVDVVLKYKGTTVASATLSESNDWTHTWGNLTGNIDDYTVEETGGHILLDVWTNPDTKEVEPNGDKETGYAVSYTDFDLVWDEDAETYVYSMSVINTHGSTPKLTATKQIAYEDLEKWLKSGGGHDFTIAFTLSGTTSSGGSYTRTEYLSFQYSKLSTYKSAADSDGYVTYSVTFGDEKFGSTADDTDILNYGTYTLTETAYEGVVTSSTGATIDKHWVLKSVTCTNGKKAYDEDGEIIGATFTLTAAKGSTAAYKAVVTNELHVNPKLVVTKKILAEEIEWVPEDATFTFTITGTDEDGTVYTEDNTPFVKTVTFDLDEISKLPVDDEGYIYITVVFGDTDLNPDDPELPFGTYTLTESGSEVYWILDGITYEDPLKLTGSGINYGEKSITFTLSINDDNEYYYTTYYNTPRLGSVTITKYDNDGVTPLAGVTFQLQDAKGNCLYNVEGVKLEAETDSEGTVTFTDLKYGTYYLTETSTLEGYSLLSEQLVVQMPLVLTEKEVNAYAASGTPVDTTGENTINSDGSWYFWDLSYEVKNTIQLEMPAAGILNSSNGAPMWPIAVCIASVFAIGAWVLIRRRRTMRLLRA